MNDLQTVRDDLTTATSTLDDLRSALREGMDVDLDGFNVMVAETCQAAISLPKADVPKVRQQLERLLDELTEARDEIASEQARLADEISADEATQTMAANASGPDQPAGDDSTED